MILQKDYKQYWHIIIPVVIVLGMFAFVQSDFFYSNQVLFTKALFFDLLIGIPIIYFVLQRKAVPDIKKLLKVFTVCLFVSTLLIPESNFELLQYLNKVVYPILKVWVGFKILQKLMRLVKEYRVQSLELSGYELYTTTLRNAFSEKIGEILRMEFSVVYFLFSRKRKSQYKKCEFGYSKNKGTVEMVSAFIFIIVIETIVAHFLIAKLNLLVACVCTYSSFYLVILFISILKSRSHFPVMIEDNLLTLQYGFINKSIVKYTDISKIERTSKSNDDDLMKLSAFKGVESHNIIIHFREPQKITKVFGIQKEYRAIGLFLDNPEGFINHIGTKLD